MSEFIVRPLKYAELDGLSVKLLSEHHDVLYAGYVRKLNEIRARLSDADMSEANASYSFYGELKREESFTANAIRLHEAYFDNLGGDGEPSGVITALINRDFGSFPAWCEDLKAAGIAARGWVVLAYDFEQKQLINYLCDAHNLGCVWHAVPLIVLDVYEHAYYLDYATGRKSYLEAFLKNLDFGYANTQIFKAGISA